MVAMCSVFKKPWLNNSVHCRVHIEMAGVAWAVNLKSYSKCLCVCVKEREREKKAFVYPILKYWKGVTSFKIISVSKNDLYLFIYTRINFIDY